MNDNSFWKNKRVLVAGGAGFIGSHAVEELVRREAKVTAQVSLSTSRNKIKQNILNLNKKVKVVRADLENEKSCNKITKNIDVVLNFAAMDGGSSFKKEHTAEIFKTNSNITLNMLEASRKSKVKRFLQISSVEVYPDNIRQPIKESYGFMKGLNEKIDGYAWSKRFSEIASKMYNSQYGMEISIVRPSNIYGPRDHLDKGRVIPTFIQQALQGKPISVWNGGKQKKSFLYVSDFIVATLSVIENYKKFDPVNIAGDYYVTIKELGKKVISVSKSRSRIKNVETRDMVFKDRFIDIKKAKKEIGFREQTSLDDGLRLTVDYMSAISTSK
jgi:nucleoside-diphosphate-sugar epimerase